MPQQPRQGCRKREGHRAKVCAEGEGEDGAETDHARGADVGVEKWVG